MIYVVHLLMVWLLLHNVSHIINVSKQKVGEIQHLDPSKVDEEPDMVSVQPRKFSLTSEIFDDNPHEPVIPILQKFEMEKPLHLTSVLRLNVRLIIMLIKVLILIPFLTNIRNLGGL